MSADWWPQHLISSGLIYVHLVPVTDPRKSNLNSCLIFRAFGEESWQQLNCSVFPWIHFVVRVFQFADVSDLLSAMN